MRVFYAASSSVLSDIVDLTKDDQARNKIADLVESKSLYDFNL